MKKDLQDSPNFPVRKERLDHPDRLDPRAEKVLVVFLDSQGLGERLEYKMRRRRPLPR